MKFERDIEALNRWRVLTDNGDYLGGIDKTAAGSDEFRSYHVAHGKRLSPVPLGPHKTLEAAFEAFKNALT